MSEEEIPDVIEVANEFLARRIFVSDTLEPPGFVCREHHFVALEGGECPYCSRPLVALESVVDELIELARLYGVDLLIVERRRDLLEPYRGIAAVLYPPA